ncbi:MAG TPA: hypothetical protein VJU61_18975 [Polyangiaceae bacterium]|nr:hypothetical protein [Polyangiaceae bacterium]
MSVSRHTKAAPSDQWPERGEDCELSFSELSQVLGGQTLGGHQETPPSADRLGQQALETGEAWFNGVPFLRPAVETGKLLIELGNYAGNYARWALEDDESRELSEERGRQLDEEQREAEEEKQREKEEEQDALLRGDRPTSRQEVQDYLDIIATEPPYSGQSPYIPSNMTDAELPQHTPRIILEPLDYTPTYHPG